MKKRLSHSDLCFVAKLHNEIGAGTNRRRKTKGSGMIALSCLTCIHSSVAAPRLPLVNNEAPSVTDPLTDRLPGGAPSLFIT